MPEGCSGPSTNRSQVARWGWEPGGSGQAQRAPLQSRRLRGRRAAAGGRGPPGGARGRAAGRTRAQLMSWPGIGVFTGRGRRPAARGDIFVTHGGGPSRASAAAPASVHANRRSPPPALPQESKQPATHTVCPSIAHAMLPSLKYRRPPNAHWDRAALPLAGRRAVLPPLPPPVQALAPHPDMSAMCCPVTPP